MRRPTSETGRSKDRNMGHDVRHVEERRSIVMLVDKLYGSFGKSAGELRLVRIDLDNSLAVIQWKWRHIANDGMVTAVVVGIRKTEILVEAISQRIKFRSRAQMP